jgi:hypothetical protein
MAVQRFRQLIREAEMISWFALRVALRTCFRAGTLIRALADNYDHRIRAAGYIAAC